MVAGSANKASRAGANGTAVQRVSVTHGPLITGVTDTSIIQMTEQTCWDSRMSLIGLCGQWTRAKYKEAKGVIPVLPTGHSQKKEATRS